MHKIWTTHDKEFVVRNDHEEVAAGPFRSWDVAEAARAMLDKFYQIDEQIKAINDTLRAGSHTGERR